MRQPLLPISTVGLLLLALAASVALAADAQAVEPVTPLTMATTDGRVFHAYADRRTDDDHLWLRWERGTARIRRPIAWSNLVEVQLGDRWYPAGLFRELMAMALADLPEAEPASLWQEAIAADTQRGTPCEACVVAFRPTSVLAGPRVLSTALDATLANWDADVEVDGLIVWITPLDQFGCVVPVDGTLDVRLIAPRRGLGDRPEPFRRLGQWTRRVEPCHFGPMGAAYRLPFQAVHPAFDLDVGPKGLVHVRLSVPGHGTLEASATDVRIRPYSAVRDRLLQTTGHRYFAEERTGHGRVARGKR